MKIIPASCCLILCLRPISSLRGDPPSCGQRPPTYHIPISEALGRGLTVLNKLHHIIRGTAASSNPDSRRGADSSGYIMMIYHMRNRLQQQPGERVGASWYIEYLLKQMDRTSGKRGYPDLLLNGLPSLVRGHDLGEITQQTLHKISGRYGFLLW
jgi:hypothetical protein